MFEPTSDEATADAARSADNLQTAMPLAGREAARSVSEDGSRTANSAAPRKRRQDRAVSTTCPVRFTEPQKYRFLGAGVDSLDVGLFVDWSELHWDFFRALDEGKRRASGSTGIPFGTDGACLILPSGKPPSYSFHLQLPEYHLYFNRSEVPQRGTPNAYLCLNSQHLWRWWVPGALQEPLEFIDQLGGSVVGAKPSRVDLCADYHIPGGLDLNFLQHHRCPSHYRQRHDLDGNRLETFYLGARKSPTQCRIYDKGREIAHHGTKFWFRDIWETDSVEDVWRVEFQLRRPVLKRYGIHSVSEMVDSLPALWKECTEEWVTLRLRDRDTNITRCELHPWWQSVTEASSKFGDFKPLERVERIPTASVEWFVSQISGCLATYAARRQLPDLDQALSGICADVRQYWSYKNWQETFSTRSIQMGFDPTDALNKENPNEVFDFQI
ncbi:replication initiation factor domain-containing protein [Planctomicrobium piriforme]|uniref:Replication initiation factor n=1 Tax=Planctomicrobium piriforme TaxID=1576369 RepID=A0A1I3M5R4_9PLAN|nr:replication initiation factor domain-containing protein [Planctomicrobium piriforme]SFI92374.1 hypothetical protein SAMN05421753_113168 [Planctomicrobium piriforme]